MARVNIDSKAFTDPRFELLSDILDYNDKYSAFGRVVFLWNYCTEHETDVVDCDLVDIICRQEDFGKHLVTAGLAEWVDVDNSIRVCGAKDRIEWISQYRNAAQKGGKARASQANRDERGHFIPSGIQPTIQPTPGAGSSALSPSIAPSISITNKTPAKVFDFEKLYDKFPRKLGKSKGMQTLKRLVKDDASYNKVAEAIDRFNKHHRDKNTGPEFIPHFSTFMNSIDDWYDPNAGKVSLPKPKNTTIYRNDFDFNKEHPPTNPKVLDMLREFKSKSKMPEDAS